jgi:hypothetical protein
VSHNFFKKYILHFIIILNLFFSHQLLAQDTAEVLKYMDANYPRQSIYKANYKMAKAKWYTLSDHLLIKPKFLILVEQPLRLNGEEKKYNFIYNSAHNFFSLVRKAPKKGRSTIPGLPVNIFQKKIMEAPKIDDRDLTLNQFVEKVFDHCRFTNMRSAKDPDNQNLNMSNYGSCFITQINAVKFKPFTEEDYKKNKKQVSSFTKNKEQFAKLNSENQSKINKKKKVEAKNNPVLEKTIIKKSEDKNIDLSKKEYLLALSWSRLDDLVVGKIKFENNNSAKITIKLNKTGDKCIGLVALTNKIGTWSLTCPENEKRGGAFKKNLSASGTLTIKNNSMVLGNGKDIFNNRINFVSNFIN